MFVIVITVSDIHSLVQAMRKIPDDFQGLLEWRLDYWHHGCLSELKQLMQQAQHPVILTLRAKRDGGQWHGPELKRLALLKQLMRLKPAYLDVEHHVDDQLIFQLHRLSPQTLLIRSYHDFKKMPEDLEALWQSLQHPACSFYKIAAMARSSLDSLKLCHWMKQYAYQRPLSAHAMGRFGESSRILAPIFGSNLTYTTMAFNPHIPHLLTLDTLNGLYRVSEFNQNTAIYALAGHPLDHSLGHQFHNQAFAQKNYQAVYIKLVIKKSELAALMIYAKALNFRGLSVTMPLKQKIIPYLDALDDSARQIGAVNTVRITNAYAEATNTDAPAAIEVIESYQPISHKHLVILGAGGASRAIAYAACQKSASVTIINRSLHKAIALAEQLGCQALSFNQTAPNCDILINTLPPFVRYTQVQKNLMQSLMAQKPLVMDVNYTNRDSLFQNLVKSYHSSYIGGETMFRHQAQRQQDYWLDSVNTGY